MVAPLIGAALTGLFEILGKVVPDPQERARMQLQIMELQQRGELKALEADLQMALAQAKINETEAASSDPFRAGWRPMVGWICATGVGYQFVLFPLLTWGAGLADVPPPPPMDLGDLLSLLFGMLGLGGFRTYEKVKGIK